MPAAIVARVHRIGNWNGWIARVWARMEVEMAGRQAEKSGKRRLALSIKGFAPPPPRTTFSNL